MIAVAGMTLLGGLLYMFDAFAGNSRVTVNDAEVYNYLQSEIENAKSELRRYMMRPENKKVQAKDIGTILSLDDIEVYRDEDDDVPFYTSRDQVSVRVGMRPGDLSVKIYDMQYDKDKIPPTPTDAGMTDGEYARFISSLPPTVSLFVNPGEEDSPTPIGTDPDGTSEEPPDVTGASAHSGVYLIRASIDFGGGLRKTIDTALVQRDGTPKQE
jgi:hypothetical protein